MRETARASALELAELSRELAALEARVILVQDSLRRLLAQIRDNREALRRAVDGEVGPRVLPRREDAA
jgi:hypothetical protein